MNSGGKGGERNLFIYLKDTQNHLKNKFGALKLSLCAGVQQKAQPQGPQDSRKGSISRVYCT